MPACIRSVYRLLALVLSAIDPFDVPLTDLAQPLHPLSRLHPHRPWTPSEQVQAKVTVAPAIVDANLCLASPEYFASPLITHCGSG